MSDKLPFESEGLPRDDDAASGLPFAPSFEAPPLPFALNDEAPAVLPFEPALPPLPFEFMDDSPDAATSRVEPPSFSLDSEPQVPALPFSLDDEPQVPALPFSLDSEDPAPFPFEAESQLPPLPVTLDDEPLESSPFAQEVAPAEPQGGLELSGAGFLFEEGEIDSPFFRRLAQSAESATAKMPPMAPMNVPAMPPAAKPMPAAEKAPPPFPPAYEPARQASPPSPPVPPVQASERPSPPPPPPGYQPPPPPGYEEAVRQVPPPVMGHQPPSIPPVADQRAYELPNPVPVADVGAYEPMTPPPVSRAPLYTGDAIPEHEAPPVAKDVSSALAAMKARLATSRQAQTDPNAALLKEAPAEYGMDMSLAPKSSKPPEIWEYRVGQSIFREGELTYELFMLMEGILDIYVGGDKVATLNAETAAGAYLGEIGALLRLPRTATVKAVTSCKFLVFPDAKRLFEEDPEFGIKLSIILAQRLAQSNERMEMVMRALYRAKVKDEVIGAVKGAFQGKESTFIAKKGWFG